MSAQNMARVPVPAYVVVLILVEDEGRYVLIQEAKPERGDPWCIPAGRVEPGESIIQAARRETLEESGLIAEPRSLLRIEHIIPYGQDAQRPYPELWRFVILAEAIGGALKTTADEHSLQARWFHPAQVATLPLRSPDVLRLIDMHCQGAPSLPIAAYVSFVAHVRR